MVATTAATPVLIVACALALATVPIASADPIICPSGVPSFACFCVDPDDVVESTIECLEWVKDGGPIWYLSCLLISAPWCH